LCGGHERGAFAPLRPGPSFFQPKGAVEGQGRRRSATNNKERKGWALSSFLFACLLLCSLFEESKKKLKRAVVQVKPVPLHEKRPAEPREHFPRRCARSKQVKDVLRTLQRGQNRTSYVVHMRYGQRCRRDSRWGAKAVIPAARATAAARALGGIFVDYNVITAPHFELRDLRSEWTTKGSAWACFFSPAALGETRLPLARVVCPVSL
jgi:hypothetical protein